jgi:hypothetical protein
MTALNAKYDFYQEYLRQQGIKQKSGLQMQTTLNDF